MDKRADMARTVVRRKHPNATVVSDGTNYVVKDGETFLGQWSWTSGDAWKRAEKHVLANEQ